MTRRVSRFHALVAAALLVFTHARGLAGVAECAQHDLASGGSHGGAHAAPAADLHAHHAAPAESQAPEQSDPCTCLDHCSGCATFALAAVMAAVFTTPAPAAGGSITTQPAALLARASHQLPFATAPPAIA